MALPGRRLAGNLLSYTIFFAQIAFFTAFALLAGKRAFCHYFCPIAVILITGRRIRDLFR